MHTFSVQKNQLSVSQVLSTASEVLSEGQVRLSLNRFAFTANNITYAAFGEHMRYWQFYPSHDPAQGNIPVWGFATVSESQCPEIAVGQRFYGYYPMASEVVLQAGRVGPMGFTDVAPRRTELAAVYNQYIACTHDPLYTVESENLQVLLRPLYLTAWLLDDFLADNQFFNAHTVLLSSASSKTALSTASCLAKRSHIRRVGFTSAANVAFCESTGFYDEVLTYDQLASLASNTQSVFLDFAGNAAFRSALHKHLPQLQYSCSIGGTHVSALGSGKNLAGPKPILFFAPAQSAKRAADWGKAVLLKHIETDWLALMQSLKAKSWISPHESMGFDNIDAVYQAVLAGKDPAQIGRVVVLS
jgi:Protein of unknown function (DUF2855)